MGSTEKQKGIEKWDRGNRGARRVAPGGGSVSGSAVNLSSLGLMVILNTLTAGINNHSKSKHSAMSESPRITVYY